MNLELPYTASELDQVKKMYNDWDIKKQNLLLQAL